MKMQIIERFNSEKKGKPHGTVWATGKYVMNEVTKEMNAR
jgi:hypothetical protein